MIPKKFKNECIRKLFHTCFLIFAFLFQIYPPRTIQAVLIIGGALYYLLEQLRLRKTHIVIISYLAKLVLRKNESHHVAYAPLTLMIGIALVIQLYTPKAAFCAIVAATIGDAFACIVGMLFSHPTLIWNKKKSLCGVLANFCSVTGLLLFFVPVSDAFMAGIVSAFIESLDLEEVDNLMIPLTVGASLYFI